MIAHRGVHKRKFTTDKAARGTLPHAWWQRTRLECMHKQICWPRDGLQEAVQAWRMSAHTSTWVQVNIQVPYAW